MAARTKLMRWIVLSGAAIFLVALIYFTVQQNQQRYEVCVSFRGQNRCATAAGASREEAVRSAQEIDCAQLANGRDENMVCLDTSPASVRAITKEGLAEK
jgi:hypothetical protein